MGHVENALEERDATEVVGGGKQGIDEFLGDLRDGFEVVRCGIDELCVNAVARRVPLVLPDEHGVAVVLIDALVDLIGQGTDQTLNQCDQAQGVAEGSGHVANANLDRAKRMVGAHVPPDFADGFDVASVDEVVDQPHVFAPVPHQGGQPGRGQPLHDF